MLVNNTNDIIYTTYAHMNVYSLLECINNLVMGFLNNIYDHIVNSKSIKRKSNCGNNYNFFL